MKIVVIGGTGLIGTQVVSRLTERGHEVLPATPKTGVDATTGRGLSEALAGAAVVIDVANSPSFEDGLAMAFFDSAGRNLGRAQREAGVRHHVALSVVGTDRCQESGYFRAKLVQEGHVKTSGIPYTIVRATQFFEFMGAIAGAGTENGRVRLSPAAFQPIASADVARIVAEVALGSPVNGMIEIAGPERGAMSELVGRYLKATGDPREIIADPQAGYFGVHLDDRTLVPGANPRLGAIGLEEWIRTRGQR